MAHRGDQIQMDEKADQHLVFDPSQRTGSGASQGPGCMAEKEAPVKYKIEHNPFTDVLFVDLCPLEEGSKVEVIELGDTLGFPGQIQARVDRKRKIFYGMTIQNYSGFRRKLLWQYRMWSVERAIYFLVSTIIAGLRIDCSRHAISY